MGAFMVGAVVILAVIIGSAVVADRWQPEPQNLPPLVAEIIAIKDNILVNITQSGFTNPVTVCDFYDLRFVDTTDYFQTTANYWVFQNGKEELGDIEAFVEIYNRPDNLTAYVVEVTRNCWYELTVSYDGVVKAVFPEVTSDDVLSLGYITFEVAAP